MGETVVGVWIGVGPVVRVVVSGLGRGRDRDLSPDGSLFLCRRIWTMAPWIPATASANLAGSLGKDPMEAPWEIREEHR
jgi:hypothetical protein